jgi:hypothetical protein
VERVRHPTRTVDKRSLNRLHHLLAVLDPDLAGEHDEELVLVPVDVEW